MQAVTVIPQQSGSLRLQDIPEPQANEELLLVQTLAIGICGTDIEIIEGHYGWRPEQQDYLVIGHESLGRVLGAPQHSGFAVGDLVVGIVRRPDSLPCPSCAVGEWDMCRNGEYRERGIKQLHGYAAERYTIEPAYAVKLAPALGLRGVLLEPCSVVAKAWEQIERIGARAAAWQPQRLLVTGAGPVGLLAALMGRQRGMEVHVFDRVREGRKPALVAQLGAHYHCGELAALHALAPDISIECTGASSVVFEAIGGAGAGGIVCLAGVSSGGHRLDIDLGLVNRSMVLENEVVFGSVNANRRHYEQAAEALARADPAWLDALITRRVPLTRWREAYEHRDGDVKVVLQFPANPS